MRTVKIFATPMLASAFMLALAVLPTTSASASAADTGASVTATTAAAQEASRPVTSRVTAATIFLQGAEVTHTASLTLKKGVNEVSIEGLSPDIDRNSMRIKIEGGVVVSAHEFSIDYLWAAKAPSARLKMLKDSMEIYQAQLDKTKIDIEINTAMKEYLSTGIAKNVSGSEAGLGIDELRKTMDYYQAKSEEILGGERELLRRRNELNKAYARVRSQYNEESGAGGKTSGILRLNLSAPTAGNFTATVVYFTSAASWSPYYDINAGATDRPISIAARSRVSQTTGLDWENVRLTLSTATPSGGKVAPLFSTWFLREMEPAMDNVVVVGYGAQRKPTLTGSVAAMNSLSYNMSADESASPQIKIRGTAAPASAPEPLYVIDGLVAPSDALSNIDPAMISNIEVLKDTAATSVYGSRAAGGVVLVTTKKSMGDFVTTTKDALNVTYEIDLPYSIPGSGKEQNIDLATTQTPAEFKYYCAPRLDGATYLIAEISNWESLGLLSAPANITYDGTYIGETRIDASATKEKLALTLGTDKRVSVTRELAREFNAPRAIGGNTEQTFTYRITVRNNQTVPVNMVLKDQYPTSTDKSVTVTLDTKLTTPPTTNKTETGVVTWEAELKPGEVRTYNFSYSVKYPREMQLDL